MKPAKFSIVRTESKKQEKINSLAKRYQEAKGRLAAIEDEVENLKGEVNVLMDSEGVDSLSTPDFTITRSMVCRESFALAKAKPVLGTVLNPFISTTQYRQIRCQESKAAAVGHDKESFKKAA